MLNSIAKILVETAKSHPKETLIAVITIVALVTIKENYGHAPKDPALFQRDWNLQITPLSFSYTSKNPALF